MMQSKIEMNNGTKKGGPLPGPPFGYGFSVLPP
jgi:hypothetical protein